MKVNHPRSLGTALACLLGFLPVTIAVVYHHFDDLTVEDLIVNAEGTSINSASSSGGLFSPQGIVTDNFETSVRTAVSLSQSVKRNVRTVLDSIDDIEAGINIPRDVGNLADDLDQALTSVSFGLTIIGVIPPVKVAAKIMKNAIKRIIPGVKQAETKSKRIDTKLKSSRTTIRKLETTFDKFNTQISSLVRMEQTLLGRVSSLKRVVKNTPSSFKPNLDAQMDNLTGSMKPLLNQFNSVQERSLAVLADTLRESRDVRGLISGLSEISDGIEVIADILDPIKSPLKNLQNALSQDVCFPTFWTKWCFSIKDILEGIDGVAGFILDPLINLAMGVLEPLLDALGLPSDLPGIPGLNKLTELENSLKAFENTMTNTLAYFTDTYNKVVGFGNEFDTFNRQLASLESNFCIDYDEDCKTIVAQNVCSPGGVESQMCRKSCGVCSTS